MATVDTTGSTSTIDYVTADQLGTPRAVSDGTGTTIWAWPYVGNAFEELSPTSTNRYVLNLRSAGEYYDAESGLNSNGYRTREQASWRFLQSDPTGLQGGISTYAAIRNSPLMGVDPQGLQTLPPSTYQIDWTNPATRAAGAQYALNLVPGYGLYNCASYGCSGWGWTFSALAVLPGVGAVSGIAKDIRGAGTLCEATGAASSLNAFRLSQQLAAEEAAGVRAPTSITSYSTHSLEQIANRDAGLGVSQSALEDAFENPNAIQYAPSSYGPTFRYVGNDATVVVNSEGNVVTGWATNSSGVGK